MGFPLFSGSNEYDGKYYLLFEQFISGTRHSIVIYCYKLLFI